MGIFEQFPYTNFHELNADWLMKELLKLKTSVEQFVAINALKYADPIQWNITKQYEKNTIVIDPLTGTAYISVQPVPSGVALTRTDYWTVVFDLGSFVVRAAKNFTNKYEEDTTLTATFPSSVNDWLIWGDTLYRVISNIVAGDQYVVDSNIRHFTIEDIIGHIEDLTTSDKSNIVAAINEVMTIIGSLTDLTTVDKSDIVAAINELVSSISDINDLIGSATLTTTDPTLIGSINEVYDKLKEGFITPEMFGAIGDGVADDSTAFKNAIESGAKTVILTNSYAVGSSIVVPKGVNILGLGNNLVNVTDRIDFLTLSGNNKVVGVNFTDNQSIDTTLGRIITSNAASNITIEFCTFENIGNGRCIDLYQSDHISVCNNIINKYAFAGIVLSQMCSYAEIEYNYIYDGQYAGPNHQYPISISAYTDVYPGAAHHIKCNYNYIENLTSIWEGIDSHAATNYEIMHNVIKGFKTGILCDSSPTGGSPFVNSNQYAEIAFNDIEVSFDGDMSGIVVSNAAIVNCHEISIHHNRIKMTGTPVNDTALQSAISVRFAGTVENVDISYNHIISPEHGVSIDGVFHNCDICNNIFEDIGSSAHVYSAINASALDSYYNINVNDNVMHTPTDASTRFATFPNVSPTYDKLIEVNRNVTAGRTIGQIVYTTAPRNGATIPAATQACGITGQLIPSTDSTIIGFFCRNAGDWVTISS